MKETESQLYASIGQNIKFLRERKKLSQSYVEKQAGIKMSMIGKYERCKAKITTRELIDLAKAFEVTVAIICGIDGESIDKVIEACMEFEISPKELLGSDNTKLEKIIQLATVSLPLVNTSAMLWEIKNRIDRGK